jgi:predicted flap endonuclease-1-like 5' DNA nuclease
VFGTSYTTAEVLWWSLVAAAIGVLVGWFLRQWLLSNQLKEQQAGDREEEESRSSALSGEVEDWKTKAAGLSSDLDARASELERRAADLERANAQIAERDKTVKNREAELKTGRKNAMRFEGQIEDRESTIAALRAAAKGSVSGEAMRRDLDAANGTIGSLRKDAEGYQATIAALRIDLDLAKRDKTDLTGRVDASATELAALTTSLAASRSTEEDLRGQLAELDNAASASVDQHRQLAELDNAASASADQHRQLADLETRLTAAIQERDGATAELRELEAFHAECTDRRAAEPAAVAEDPEDESLSPSTEPTPPEDLRDKDAAIARVAARTRGAGPVVEDDLKRIHGVGPKLAGLLKNMDITSFRQVANFTPDDIPHVTAALDAFPGRIERDDWMASAAEEHSRKYNERS